MSQLTGKNVLVVGVGNSAMDIAVESSYVARQTFLSGRRGAYIIPKYILGRPSLPFPPWLPWQFRQFLFQRIVRVAVGPVERYGLQKPHHKILQTQTIQIDMPQYVRSLQREQVAGRRCAATVKRRDLEG